MSTYEDRLTSLEKRFATFERNDRVTRDGINKNETMTLGMLTFQQEDIKDIKLRLLSIDDRLVDMQRDLYSMQEDFNKKFDRILKLLEKES